MELVRAGATNAEIRRRLRSEYGNISGCGAPGIPLMRMFGGYYPVLEMTAIPPRGGSAAFRGDELIGLVRDVWQISLPNRQLDLFDVGKDEHKVEDVRDH